MLFEYKYYFKLFIDLNLVLIAMETYWQSVDYNREFLRSLIKVSLYLESTLWLSIFQSFSSFPLPFSHLSYSSLFYCSFCSFIVFFIFRHIFIFITPFQSKLLLSSYIYFLFLSYFSLIILWPLLTFLSSYFFLFSFLFSFITPSLFLSLSPSLLPISHSFSLNTLFLSSFFLFFLNF